jgi:hypothetical protein
MVNSTGSLDKIEVMKKEKCMYDMVLAQHGSSPLIKTDIGSAVLGKV